MIDGIFSCQHATRKQDAHEQRVAEIAMIRNKVAECPKTIVTIEHEERACLGYGLYFLIWSQVGDS